MLNAQNNLKQNLSILSLSWPLASLLDLYRLRNSQSYWYWLIVTKPYDGFDMIIILP